MWGNLVGYPWMSHGCLFRVATKYFIAPILYFDQVWPSSANNHRTWSQHHQLSSCKSGHHNCGNGWMIKVRWVLLPGRISTWSPGASKLFQAAHKALDFPSCSSDREASLIRLGAKCKEDVARQIKWLLMAIAAESLIYWTPLRIMMIWGAN